MNCSNCSTEIPFDERFCRNCGREVEWVPPTIYAGATGQPVSRSTDQFSDPMRTESLSPQVKTDRDWIPPVVPIASVSGNKKERRSLLVPVTVASITIATVSIGALAYIMMSKNGAGEIGSRPPEKPQPSVTTSVPSITATPTPTVQSTPSPTPTPISKPTPDTEIPPGARLGYCNDTNVFVRSAPNLNARPLTKITRGQKLWVIATSTNFSTWNGINSNWTQVQLYNGSIRGWVFTPFVSY